MQINPVRFNLFTKILFPKNCIVLITICYHPFSPLSKLEQRVCFSQLLVNSGASFSQHRLGMSGIRPMHWMTNRIAKMQEQGGSVILLPTLGNACSFSSGWRCARIRTDEYQQEDDGGSGPSVMTVKKHIISADCEDMDALYAVLKSFAYKKQIRRMRSWICFAAFTEALYIMLFHILVNSLV